MNSQQEITAVCFTYALPGGLWLKGADGRGEWMADARGMERFPDQWGAWCRTAQWHGMTGMWYNVKKEVCI